MPRAAAVMRQIDRVPVIMVLSAADLCMWNPRRVARPEAVLEKARRPDDLAAGEDALVRFGRGDGLDVAVEIEGVRGAVAIKRDAFGAYSDHKPSRLFKRDALTTL